MADNNEQQNSASVPIPSDKEFPFTVTEFPLKELTSPNGMRGLGKGHKQADPRAVQNAASARYQAEVAAANAKSAAQYRADTQTSRPQHPTPKSTQGPAPKVASPKPIKKGK